MEELIELGNVLREELKIYTDLFDISTKKTRVLLEGDLKKLQAITDSEQTLILNIGKLEEQRYKILKQLEEPLGVKAEDMTASEIVARLEPDNTILPELQYKIVDLLSRLSEVNKTNSMLIQKALTHINHTIGALTSAAGSGTTYGPHPGEKNDNQVINFIDHKI